MTMIPGTSIPAPIINGHVRPASMSVDEWVALGGSADDPVLEVRTVEEWAEAAGYLPEVFAPVSAQVRMDATPMDNRPGLVAVAGIGGALSALRRGRNPEFWKFSAARAHNAWPIGAEMTQADFVAAVEAAITHPMG